MATEGLATSVSDVGVGALLALAAVRGARLNVVINGGGLSDPTVREDYLARADRIATNATAEEARILALVEARMAASDPG